VIHIDYERVRIALGKSILLDVGRRGRTSKSGDRESFRDSNTMVKERMLKHFIKGRSSGYWGFKKRETKEVVTWIKVQNSGNEVFGVITNWNIFLEGVVMYEANAEEITGKE